MNFLLIGIKNLLKMNTRKYFKLSLITGMLILIVSCDRNDDNKFIRSYILENSTNHKIELKFFNRGERYFIGDNILNENRTIFSRKSSDQMARVASAIAAYQGPDSLVIIFDNNRKGKITWNGDNTTLEGINKNLFSDEVYTIENNENYRYVFIEEDYNNAIDCNGNCD